MTYHDVLSGSQLLHKRHVVIRNTPYSRVLRTIVVMFHTVLTSRAIAMSMLAVIVFAHPVRAQITRAELVSVERHRVLEQADRYLNEKPVTITAVRAERSAGGVHDFYSEGDYWWPDPSDSTKPYIRRDGETNPANFEAHRNAMRRLSQIVPALVAAYEITGD